MLGQYESTRIRRGRAAFAGLLAFLAATATRGQSASFPFGVASGDVTDAQAVLWTCVAAAAPLTVQVAEDPHFAVLSAVASVPRGLLPGDPAAAAPRVFVVSGLQPRRTYYYRFVAASGSAAADEFSPIGHFRTAPPPAEPAGLRFAFSGDSNFAYAPFVLLDSVAAEDAEFFLWFGDTIYADVPAAGLGRATTLADYRAKYRQLRGDAHVQRLSAAMPVLVGWDDHEVANDYAGADPDLSPAQRDAAYQAFFEHMPIAAAGEPADPFRTYRRVQYGANIEFFLLDGRQYREPSARAACHGHFDPTGYVAGSLLDDPDCAARLSDQRTLLGAAQLEWLLAGLRASTATVKFVVTSVPLQFLGIFPYDRWDGYDAERRILLEFIANNAIDGVFFLTTDFHGNFYNPDVFTHFRRYRPDYNLAPGAVAPELVVGPIGQATFQHTLDELRAAVLERAAQPAVRDLLNVLETTVYRQLRRVSGVTFVEPNRLAYALIDVSEAGRVNVQLKGFAPAAPATSAGAPVAELFFERSVGPPEPPGGPWPCCGLPVFVGFLGVGLTAVGWNTRARIRTGSPTRRSPD